MLRLTANDTTLDLSNVSFNLTLRSPVSGNSGSYVYSVTLPYTDNNAAAFGFPYRLQRRNKSRATASGKIWWNNRVIQRGVWQAKTTGSETISLQMLISAGIFADSIEGKNLPELFDKAISVPDIVTHLESQVQQSWPDVEYNFPTIYNPQFYGDPKETDPDKNKNPQFEGFLNNYKNGFVHNDTANRNTISPQLYLAYMVKHIFAGQGYTMQGSPLTEEMFSRAMIYNNFALDKMKDYSIQGDYSGNYGTLFTALWNNNLKNPANLYDTSTGEYLADLQGTYELSYSITYTRNENYDLNLLIRYNDQTIYTKTIPREAGNNNTETIKVQYQYAIDENNLGKKFKTDIFFDDGSGNFGDPNITSAKINITNITQPSLNILRGDFNYKDLVPDMPVKDFLKAVYKGFGIVPFFNEKTKTLTLVSWTELLTKSEPSDLLKDGLHRHSLKITANNYQGITASFNFSGTDKLSNDGKEKENKGTLLRFSDFQSDILGERYYVKSVNAYYSRQYVKELGFSKVLAESDLFPGSKIDDGKETMTFNLAPMRMRCVINQISQGVTGGEAYRNLPSISAEGTSDAYNIRNDFPLRVMFWIGLSDPLNQSGTGTQLYPFATTTKYDTLGNIVLPINWKTDDILSRYYAEWQTWLQRREKVEFSQELTAADMSVLDFEKAYHFQYALILLEESYTRLKNHEFGPVKLKGWTV